MSLKRIFWSILAGVSMSLAGCDGDGGPEDTSVDEMQVAYGPVEAAESTEADLPPDIQETTDAAAEDTQPSDATADDLSVAYGPPPDL